MALDRAGTIVFSVYGPIARCDLPGLCDRICRLLEQEEPSIAFCDVGGVEASAVTADALARLQLAARRRECQIRLRGCSPELRSLIRFMGLDAVLPDEAL